MRQRNLHGYGLAIDIKGNTGYVVAPPSLHKSGATYTLDRYGWSALKELPPFNIAALNALFEERRPCHREPPDGCVLREGERHVGLNSQLCHAVARHQSLEALLDHAVAINQTCVPPLPAKEVVGIAKSVWDDFRAGKIKGWHGGPSVVKTSRAEMQDLLNYGRHGPDALALLVLLRANHAARCLRGEHFAITPKSIVEHGHLPGFTRQRIENARDLALKSGQLIRVRPFDRKTHAPAQYKLAQAQ